MVEIRQFRSGDERDLVLHANDYEVVATLRDAFPHPYTYLDATQWIEASQKDTEGSIRRAIVLNDRLIGAIGALRDSDVHRFNAEVGYWLGKSHWGRGYATQALQSFVPWLFAHTDLNRLYAGVFGFNQPSMRVLIKAGFRQEAIHKDAIYKNDQFWDEHYYVRLSTFH